MIDFELHQVLSGAYGPMELVANLQLEPGSFNVLYGKSGAGKTSLLRMLAGLMTPASGQIRVGQITWYDSATRIFIPPQNRNIGFVFQDYALFPNMTVRQNLEFAGGQHGDNSWIEELIAIGELEKLQQRRPATLSGGQRQRVALARALVRKPDLLLLDEPLSALDREMRVKLQEYLLDLHRRLQFTAVLVTHDISEILRLADRVIALENGKVIKDGPVREVFAHQEVSGKFQFTGEVLEIERQDFLFIISILIGKEFVRVIADEQDAADLVVGDKVLVASKAFNPIIRKL